MRRSDSIIGSAASRAPLTRGAAKKMKTPAKTGASIAFNGHISGGCTPLKKHLVVCTATVFNLLFVIVNHELVH